MPILRAQYCHIFELLRIVIAPGSCQLARDRSRKQPGSNAVLGRSPGQAPIEAHGDSPHCHGDFTSDNSTGVLDRCRTAVGPATDAAVSGALG